MPFLLAVLLVPAGAAPAADGEPAVRELSFRCVGCHGALGISDNVAWPDLAGQSAVYLAKQLRDYRAGRRQDPWMSQMALPLTDPEIDALAAYFSALPGLGAGDAATTAPAAAACAACHSRQGRDSNSQWPALAGQKQSYLAKQLRDFQADRRADPVMAPLARPLSAEQVDALAAYFAGLTPAAAGW